MKTIIFDKQREQQLRETLAVLQSKEAVLSYYQLQGLLFALACSPEPIKPSEWFDLIWLNDEPQFEHETQARDFYQLVNEFSKHIAQMAQQRRFLPFSVAYSERWQAELAQWCEGLLMGHQYLEDVWLITLDDLNDPQLYEDIDICLSLAATFTDVTNARQLSLEQGLELTDEHMPEAYELFWKVLASYAAAASLWSQGAWDFDAEQMFLELESVPPDQLCPCGSGEVFARCCLH